MKSLDEMIAVMEASKTKEIECRNPAQAGDPWEPIAKERIRWNWAACDYRVKAQAPRRVWIAYDMYGNYWPLKQADSTLSNAAEFVELTKEIRERLGL